MGKKRDQIRMTDDEIREFLAQQKTIILTSIGQGGFPHPMPMWFAVDPDGTIRMTTFAKSQKVLNLKRNPKVTLLAEDGEEYSELRGLLIQANAEIVVDVERAIDTMLEIAGNDPMAEGSDTENMRGGVRAVAEKRVVILCKPEKIVSFDHRKLGGAY